MIVYSIFLFLLLFTLSTSIDFGIIIEPALYLWNVPEHWRGNLKYVVYDYTSDESSSLRFYVSQWDNRDSDLPNTYTSDFGIPNSGIPELGILEQPILDTQNTYIILKIDSFHFISLFYWVGVQSSEKKRKNTASSVALILQELHTKMGYSFVPHRLSREVEGAESVEFTDLLRLPPAKIKEIRLYRVAGTNGQFIMEVPLIYSELNGSDSFVLDQYFFVQVWNSRGTNEEKRTAAMNFGMKILQSRICTEDVGKYLTYLDEGASTPDHDRIRFTQDFLSDIKETPKPAVFPNEEIEYTDKEMENKIDAKKELHKYYWHFKGVLSKHIYTANPKLKKLDKTNIYIMTDFQCANIFVYIGSEVPIEVLRQSLIAAEEFSWSIELEHKIPRVKILYQQHRLPIYFTIYFSK